MKATDHEKTIKTPKEKNKYKILPILLAAITIASIAGVYFTQQLPAYENITTTLCSYRQIGTYNYTAELNPNIIYNRTTLRPGEGPLYTAILDHIDLNFAYTFVCYPEPTDTTVSRELSIELEAPKKWTRKLSPWETQELLKLHGNPDFNLIINSTKLQSIVEDIEEETGIRSTTYNLNIKPEIKLKAQTESRIIDESFNPQLTISFITGGEKGNYIEFTGLTQTKPGEITEESRIEVEGVASKRLASYLITAISAIALAASVYQYVGNRPEVPESKKIKKMISPYKEFVTESIKAPPEMEVEIEMETLEDLAKTAEIMAKPIIHTKLGSKHIFYIIEDNRKYQYEIQMET